MSQFFVRALLKANIIRIYFLKNENIAIILQTKKKLGYQRVWEFYIKTFNKCIFVLCNKQTIKVGIFEKFSIIHLAQIFWQSKKKQNCKNKQLLSMLHILMLIPLRAKRVEEFIEIRHNHPPLYLLYTPIRSYTPLYTPIQFYTPL